MTAAAATAFLLLTGRVRSVERLSPSFVRIALGGPGFEHLGPDRPTYDQRVKLLIPSQGHGIPSSVMTADNWYAAWLALPEVERGHVRTYTARLVRGEGEGRELVIDFVLHGTDGTVASDDHVGTGHGAAGPAAAWAAAAQPGDEIGVLAPRRGLEAHYGGIEFAPGDADHHLVLVADETALPALASILEALPDDAEGCAVIEVPAAADFLDVGGPAGVERHWIARGNRPRGAASIARVRRVFGIDDPGPAVERSVDPDEEEIWETIIFSSSGESDVVPDHEATPRLGPDQTYAWVAGDSDTVKAVRRLLVGELGLPRHQVAFMGYWKEGRPQL